MKWGQNIFITSQSKKGAEVKAESFILKYSLYSLASNVAEHTIPKTHFNKNVMQVGVF